MVDLQYYINFKCATEWFSVCRDYALFKVIIKYCIFLCCTVYPCSLFILYILGCTFSSLNPASPLPSPHWQPLVYSLSLSALLYSFICFIYLCSSLVVLQNPYSHRVFTSFQILVFKAKLLNFFLYNPCLCIFVSILHYILRKYSVVECLWNQCEFKSWSRHNFLTLGSLTFLS